MLNINSIIGKFINNSSEREISKLKSIIEKINNCEPKIRDISSENFPAKTAEFKSKIKKNMSEPKETPIVM